MKIAINTRLLIKNRLDGIGWFTFEVCKRMSLTHPEHQFYFLFDRKYDESFIFSKNVTPVVLNPPTRHPVLWYFWLEVSVAGFLRKNNVDIFVSPDGFIPLWGKTPSVSVIHDINFLHRPKDLPFFARKYYNYFFPRFAKKACRVGTVSHYSARDICNSYTIPQNKIDVFHNGVNDEYHVLKEGKKEEIRKRVSGGLPYFCFIGTLHPRKNVAGLLYSWDLFRKKSKEKIKLLIVGEKFFLTEDIDRALKSLVHSEDVIFTGRLNPDELKEVLGASLSLTFIPFFEGFGIPVIEAMKCGVPVIASNVTSLPEVGGDAVLYADPDDREAIAGHMKFLAENPLLRQELIKKGLERVKMFNWDHTAEGLWNTISRVYNGA